MLGRYWSIEGFLLTAIRVFRYLTDIKAKLIDNLKHLKYFYLLCIWALYFTLMICCSDNEIS